MHVCMSEWLRRLLLSVAAILAMSTIGLAEVHAVSTDGEATVYLTADFAHDFDVSYDVQFPAWRGNRSLSFVSLLLLGRFSPSGSVGVGLSRGSPHETALSGFTDAAGAKATPVYRSIAVPCSSECNLELRGNRTTIDAFIDHKVVGTWARKSLNLKNPYIQINGEVSAVGDRIVVRLTPVRMQVGSHSLPAPTCAFTTQGVTAQAAAGGGLTFTGRRDLHAAATYVSLLTGATGDTCHEARAKHTR